MKLATIALASAFALSSTFALAATSHHKNKSGARTHQGTVGMSSAQKQRAIGNYSRSGGCGANGCAGAAGGLVGGSDAGTYKP
jgi:hypothetical protein